MDRALRRGSAPLSFFVGLLVAAPGLFAQQAGDERSWGIPGTEVSFSAVYVPGDPPLWVGTHEVTGAEYAVFRRPRLDSPATADPGRTLDVDAVTRPSPPYEDPAHGLGAPDRPATGMTRLAALRYAHWLSLKTGRLWRLPTEPEWERACRAGGTGVPEDAAEAAWFIGNSAERLHAVGTREPNAWGLYDMLGNAAEWTDPSRVARGGAFDDDMPDCSTREAATPAWKARDPQIPKSRWWNTDSQHVGFRLVTPDREYTLAEIEAWFVDAFSGG